jgi:hypothetical protein
MNSVKYVGMDVHKAITVIVVLNAAGQIESRTQVKTKAENFCDFFRGLSGRVEVVFEEGTQSAWLYQLIKPLVAAVMVCGVLAVSRRDGSLSPGLSSIATISFFLEGIDERYYSVRSS